MLPITCKGLPFTSTSRSPLCTPESSGELNDTYGVPPMISRLWIAHPTGLPSHERTPSPMQSARPRRSLASSVTNAVAFELSTPHAVPAGASAYSSTFRPSRASDAALGTSRQNNRLPPHDTTPLNRDP